MNLLIRGIMAALLGVAFGGLSALWFGGLVSGGPKIGNAIQVDSWRSDWSIGSVNADPYVRARVARNGLMGLRKEEAVYFISTEDDQGERLSADCTYVVSGESFPARWWSITLYDGENRLPMNSDGRLSFDQTQAETAASDSKAAWAFQVSAARPSAADMPWVSSRAGGFFDLTLRLYQPSDDLLANPESALVPPQIERVACTEETS